MGKGRPSGPTVSSVSLARSEASQRVPGPRASNTISTVPPWSGRTSWTAKARRPSMEVSGPPTAIVMNWPGRNLVAMAGATSVSAW